MTDIDPFEALPEDRRPQGPLSEEPRPRRRWLLGAVLTIAIFGGFSAIAWVAYNRGFYSASDELAPLVQAEEGPTRRRPADPGGLEIPDQDKLVFERLSPGQSQAGVERLLPEPEQPLPLPEPAADPAPVEQLADGPAPDVPSPDAQPDAVAAAEPTGDLNLDDVIAAVSDDPPAPPPPPGSDAGDTPVADAEPPAAPAPPPVPEAPAAVAEAEQPVPQPEQPIIAAAPQAEPEPSTPAPPEVERLPLPEAAVTPANGTDPAPAPPPAAAGDGWRIQLASVRDESGAAAEWRRLQGKHPDLLGSLALSIQRADLDAGTFYRIQAGPMADQAAARQRCADLNAAGQDCLIVRP